MAKKKRSGGSAGKTAPIPKAKPPLPKPGTRKKASPLDKRPRRPASLSPKVAGDFPIAAIGASAGGLEAFQRLLGALPRDANIAFVILQHLAPQYESMLPELLAKVSPLPVREAREGMALEPGIITVMPPNVTMTLAQGRLRLSPRAGRGHIMPVDIFLRSLAEDQPHRAIAVILSGAGSDGAIGIHEVKASGGITFVQDEKTAKFDGMPRSALAAGAVDFILPPEEIALELARLCRQYQKQFPRAAKEPPTLEESQVTAIFGILRQTNGVDFSQYKQTTLKRRILRRMLLKRMETLGEYVDFLKQNHGEAQALYQDMLIKVTSFFRDPEVFDALKNTVFPDLLERRSPEAPLRIWVPGCSTGEEVYSLAIALLECLGEMAVNTPVQIFATDISEEALVKARSGLYLENIAMDMSPERLRRFFTRVSSSYQISKHIRDMCIFARHDVTREHPFSRIDLISCRNVLIYLDSYLQKKVFPIFHYALKPTGYLMLGSAESVGSFTDLFTATDKKHKFYAKKLVPIRFSLPLTPGHYTLERPEHTPKRLPEQAPSGLDVQREADKVVLSSYSPAGVVVNGGLDIIQFRGQTSPYLEPSPGQASLSLLKMIRPPLLVDLRKALEQARRTGAAARKRGLRVQSGEGSRLVDLEVAPLAAGSPGPERYYLVLFHEAAGAEIIPRAGAKAKARDGREGSTSRELRKELEATKEYLQSIIEEQEATNEELKSANEEILSSNEELQSINEELETAKEELQSTNEELTTLNEELQNRNLELNQVNGDMSNLLGSVNVPIVMLGNDLRIRRFTPMAEKLLKLIPTDVGRSLSDIQTGMSVQDFDHVIMGVINTVGFREMEIRDHTGRWYSLRIQPYRTAENKIDGAVMVFIDIDNLRNSLSQLQEARLYAESIVEPVRIPLLAVDVGGIIKAANRAYLETFPGGGLDVVGRSLFDLGFGGRPIPGLEELLAEAADQPGLRDREIELPDPAGNRALLVRSGTQLTAQDKRRFIFLAMEDITDRKRADGEVLRLNSELEARIRELTFINHKLKDEVGVRQRAEESLQSTIADLESFSYSVSHDLRAPLRAMQGVAEALEEDYRDRLDETGKDYTRRIVSAAHRMDTLIQDLLTFSRIDQADKEVQSWNLQQAVDNAVEQLEKDIRDKSAEVAVARPLGHVLANPALLATVILNLISNAVKFVPPGEQPRVRVRSEARNGMVRLWVEDNGIGIEPEHQQRVFRVFERLHGSDTYPGTGIGLAIVRKGVESLGGKVGLESSPGKGSRFWVELPAAAAREGV